jgi:DNA mismatch repair protein MutL
LHCTPIWKIIWQTFNSYIIVETENSLKILDQHAIAERIIYEKLVSNQYFEKTQKLLIPENINLTTRDFIILEEEKNIFKEMWCDFEFISWKTVILTWIPDFIKKENLQNIFESIISDISDFKAWKSKTMQEVRNKIFAYTACRSAVKFWNKLNIFEINKLLNDSILDYSSTCPHWRPVVYEINLSELKWKYER